VVGDWQVIASAPRFEVFASLQIWRYSTIARMIARPIYKDLLGAFCETRSLPLLGPHKVGKGAFALEVDTVGLFTDFPGSR